MYVPTLVDVQLSGLPRVLGPQCLVPAPSLREEEDGALVSCIKVSGTSTITYSCEELPPALEEALEERGDAATAAAAAILPKKYLCAGANFLRFHAHPNTVTLSTVKVMCGKRQLKVEAMKPLFTVAAAAPADAASASSGKGGKAKPQKKNDRDAAAAASSAAASSSATPSSSPMMGLYELVLGEPLPSGPQAIGQSVQIVANFTTLCRPATAHGTVGMYYYTASNTSSSSGPYVATTHFEVTHARRAFPCVDDSEVRTRWRLQVGYESGGGGGSAAPTVYSCAAEEDGSNSNGSTFTFSTLATPIPAYAFAFLAASNGDLFTTITAGADGKDRSSLQTARGTSLTTRVLVGTAFNAQHPQLGPFGMSKLHDAIVALEDLFDAPLPLEDKVDLVFMGRMTPALAGMEHHGLIYISDSVWTGGAMARLPAGSPKFRDEVTSLIIHELCHHWLGNAIGMPFAYKEGLCQVLEVCVLDVLEGRPIRKLTVNKQQQDSAAGAGAGGKDCNNPKCSQAGKQSASSSSADGGMTQADEGKELTGLTYQKAYVEMAAVASDWPLFVQGLQQLVADKMGEFVTGAEVGAFFTK